MTLAEAIYPRSNSLRAEPAPYQPHRPASQASKEPWKKRSPGQFVAVATAPSDQARVHALRFGQFRLVLHSRELLAGAVPLSVGSRALDVLFALIEARGELVTKDELLSRVWPNTTVEENNLQFQVSTLRKVLGEDRDFIRTVSGRGYRFVAEVTAECRPPRRAPADAAPSEQSAVINLVRDRSDLDNLAVSSSDHVELEDPGAMVAANRLVTLVGAEGVGKMRVALGLARRTLPATANDADNARFASVTRTDPALGLESALPALEGTAAALDSRKLLLLLDSCEHIIETVTSVAEALLQANAKL